MRYMYTIKTNQIIHGNNNFILDDGIQKDWSLNGNNIILCESDVNLSNNSGGSKGGGGRNRRPPKIGSTMFFLI